MSFSFFPLYCYGFLSRGPKFFNIILELYQHSSLHLFTFFPPPQKKNVFVPLASFFLIFHKLHCIATGRAVARLAANLFFRRASPLFPLDTCLPLFFPNLVLKTDSWQKPSADEDFPFPSSIE